MGTPVKPVRIIPTIASIRGTSIAARSAMNRRLAVLGNVFHVAPPALKTGERPSVSAAPAIVATTSPRAVRQPMDSAPRTYIGATRIFPAGMLIAKAVVDSARLLGQTKAWMSSPAFEWKPRQ